MKKLVKYGVLPACLLLLAACSSKPATEKKAAKEDKVEQSSESKEEKTKNEKVKKEKPVKEKGKKRNIFAKNKNNKYLFLHKEAILNTKKYPITNTDNRKQ